MTLKYPDEGPCGGGVEARGWSHGPDADGDAGLDPKPETLDPKPCD